MKKKKKFNLQRHLRKQEKFKNFLEKRSEMQFVTALDKDELRSTPEERYEGKLQ